MRPGGRIALLEVAEPDNRAAAGGPRLLLRQGRAPHRRAAVGPRRLPLPAEVGRVPARTRRSCSRCCVTSGSTPFAATCVPRRGAARHRPRDRESTHRSIVWRIDADLDPILVAGDQRRALAARRVRARRPRRGDRGRPADSRRPRRRGHRRDRRHRRRIATSIIPAAGPVAFGALPFDTATPADDGRSRRSLFGHERDGTRWLCWTGSGEPTDVQRRARAALRTQRPRGRADDVHGHQPAAAARLVRRGRGRARRAASRRRRARWCWPATSRVACDAPVTTAPVLARLRDGYPTCFVSRCPRRDRSLGASPELLVSRHGDVVRSQPMAGTTRRSPDPAVDARARRRPARLAQGSGRAPDHDRHGPRHAAAVVLLPRRRDRTERRRGRERPPPRHRRRRAACRTRCRRCSSSSHALHPHARGVRRPSRRVAGDLIRRHEGLDRGAYAAPVGWVDRHGNGEFAVGVRSAEITGNEARLFAGVGVVADSEPDAELEETRVKLQAMLGARRSAPRAWPCTPRSPSASTAFATAALIRRCTSTFVARSLFATTTRGPCPTPSSPRQRRGGRHLDGTQARAREPPRHSRCHAVCRRAVRSARRPSAEACGRNEKIPPPSLSMTTIVRSTSRRASATSADESWRNARSPTSATVGNTG